MKESVYELSTAKPHLPPRATFQPHDYVVYCQGYQMALAMALKVLEHAEVRFGLYTRTKRLEAKRKREGERHG